MAEFTSFFNPMSRALIAHWALAEAGADFDVVEVGWEAKPQALLDANPMGKLPTIIHHRPEGDCVVSEAAAICHYLAETCAPELLPQDSEKADYFRMLFFAAGPVEAAVTAKSMGWAPEGPRQEGTVGFGSFERTMAMLEGWFDAHDYVCGGRFTMADVYVGSQVDWGLRFGSMPASESLSAYQARMRERPAYQQSMGSLPG